MSDKNITAEIMSVVTDNFIVNPKNQAEREAVVFIPPAIVAGFMGFGAEIFQLLANSGVPGQLEKLVYELIHREKLFHDFVYSGSDFSATFVGTTAIAGALSLMRESIVKKVEQEFHALRASTKDEKAVKLLNKQEMAIKFLLSATEFTIIGVIGSLFTFFWLVDELNQFKDHAFGTPQTEDLYAYLAGFMIALGYYVATQIQCYIQAYGAKEEINSAHR